MTDYERWELNPAYSLGVELYKHLGGNDVVLLSLFSLPETSFTRSKLEEALRDISGKPEKKAATSEGLEPSKEKTPEPVLTLIRQRSQLHEALFHTTSKSDRHKIALRILAMGKTLDRYYDHGQLPAGEAENEMPESDIPVNAWELHQLINNNMAYMAKNKNREDKQGEIKRRDRMNGDIEERLKAINHE